MKAKYLYILILLIVVSGCKPTPAGQQVNQQVNDVPEPAAQQVNDEPDDVCEPPSTYACHPVYEDDAPPAVCGCTPRCESGTFLEVGVGEGNNPDGTRKGVFSCK